MLEWQAAVRTRPTGLADAHPVGALARARARVRTRLRGDDAAAVISRVCVRVGGTVHEEATAPLVREAEAAAAAPVGAQVQGHEADPAFRRDGLILGGWVTCVAAIGRAARETHARPKQQGRRRHEVVHRRRGGDVVANPRVPVQEPVRITLAEAFARV